MLLVSGLIADADWVTRLWGAGAFLRGHRTATHSLLGTAVIVVSVAAASWLVGRRSPKWSVGMVPALAICAIGAGTHLFLDLLDDYGVKLLWPFTQTWYSWDLVYATDWWILFFLLAGFLIPELLRLVHEEIGSKPKRSGRRGAITGLALMGMLIVGRAVAHQSAVALLDSRNYRGQTPLKVATFPGPSNPLLWSGIVETDNMIIKVEVPLGPGRNFDPEVVDVHFKPEPSPMLKNAIASPAAAEFLNFARFPIASVQHEGDGFRVLLRDLRFALELGGKRAVVAVIHENAKSEILDDRIEFDSETPR
jgi:membrane-bound metal-dependent hydrolase YbcI (DUF457 family)